MDNKTYRYFKGTPLYGFGYGLSYTSFKYDDLKILPKNKKEGTVSVSVKITNTGKTEGEEVAQLYLSNLDSSIKTSLKSLKGFERISLKHGESKTINFTLTPEDLSYVTEDGKLHLLDGKIELTIGGHQPDEKNISSSGMIKKSLIIQ